MRRPTLTPLLIPILTLTLACERNAATAPPVPEPIGDTTADDPAPVEASTKPDGCSDAQDCANQGTLALLSGDPRAIEMLDYACDQGSPTGCQNLSTALRGDMVPQDPVAAHAAAARGCELGNASACVDLGVDASLGQGGAAQDQAAALQHFTAACEGDNAKGCRYVGVLYAEGSLGSPDFDAAKPWFARGCEMSDPESCFNLGVLAINVEPPDLAAALQFMTRACELDDQDGCAAVPQIEAELAKANAKVANANLRVGSATVDGLTVNELECRVEGGGLGLLGNMALIGALAKRKAKIDKCGKPGAMAEIRWTATGGKISKAEGVGPEGECVAKQLRGLATPADGECAAMIVIGP